MKRQLEEDLWTDLTEVQEQVLDYIEDCIQAGLPPTRAEMAAHFGWKSANTADEHLRALSRRGRIELIPFTARGIKLVSL